LEEIKGEAGPGTRGLAPSGTNCSSRHHSEAAPIHGNAVSQAGPLGCHSGIHPQANRIILWFYTTHGSRLFDQSSEHVFSLAETIQSASDHSAGLPLREKLKVNVTHGSPSGNHLRRKRPTSNGILQT
jgi:hypothetical protein